MDVKPARGFTLVELIVVILLLAIVSVYAASRYSGKGGIDMKLLESELLSSLRLTQLRAMHRNGLCNRWLVYQNQAAHVSPSVSQSDCVFSIPSESAKDSSYVDASENGGTLRIVTNTGDNYLDFDSLGKASQCAVNACQVQFQSGSGETRSICINEQGGIDAC